MCMQFYFNKIPSKMFLFTACMLLLFIPFRKAINSASPGVKLCAMMRELKINATF